MDLMRAPETEPQKVLKTDQLMAPEMENQTVKHLDLSLVLK